MGEGKGPIDTVTEETKALAVEVYKDGGRPVVKAIGDAAGSIAKLALGMFKALADVGNVAIERFQEKLTAKLMSVPPERQQLPPPTIAGPALMQVLLLGPGDDVEELREMFAKLLVASMDTERAASVHPSFVSILTQLTPDEAWLLKSIDRPDYAAYDAYEHADNTKRSLGVWTLLGRGIGIDESRLQQYVSNLDRLGILRIDLSSSAIDHGGYEKLSKLIDAAYGDERNIWSHGGRILVTPLGEHFLDVCVRSKS